MKREYRFLLASLLLAMMAGCSTLEIDDDASTQVSNDPFQKMNRSVFAFNDATDKAVLRPVAKVYNHIVPQPAQRGISHFFSNLTEPLNALNNLLQGKFDRALSSTYRFAVNSTVGLLGFKDVAKSLDVAPAKEDFGQTLATWGVPAGPYIMVPLLGPSNLRDLSSGLIDTAIFYPVNEITQASGGRFALFAVDRVNVRAHLLGTDSLLDMQLDPYGFVKQAAEQNRTNEIYDGQPPEIEEDF